MQEDHKLAYESKQVIKEREELRTLLGWGPEQWAHDGAISSDRKPAGTQDLEGNVLSVEERRELSETCIPLPSFGLSNQESHSLRRTNSVNAIFSPIKEMRGNFIPEI